MTHEGVKMFLKTYKNVRVINIKTVEILIDKIFEDRKKEICENCYLNGSCGYQDEVANVSEYPLIGFGCNEFEVKK